MQFGQTDLGRMVLWLLRSQSSASQTPTAFGQNQNPKHRGLRSESKTKTHRDLRPESKTKTHAAFARI
jgi:hypothetical protein